MTRPRGTIGNGCNSWVCRKGNTRHLKEIDFTERGVGEIRGWQYEFNVERRESAIPKICPKALEAKPSSSISTIWPVEGNKFSLDKQHSLYHTENCTYPLPKAPSSMHSLCSRQCRMEHFGAWLSEIWKSSTEQKCQSKQTK